LQAFFPSRKIIETLYISVVIFFTYTSVFAYRKAFSVATFEGERILGISYQTSLIISQVIGYMLSKFVGIKIISELKRSGRWKASAMLLGIAWFSLFLFAILPSWAGLICFLVNGFALGFMWGVVFSYAEGRRSTDFIGSVLAVSFIFAGGFTRSIGKWLIMNMHVSEKWMPFVTGLVFALPLAFFLYLLEKAPLPDSEDKEERVERIAMDAGQRKKIISGFRPGIIAIAITYGLLTIMRDIRDNYMGNMWNELGFSENVSVLARSETRISIIVLFFMSILVLVRKNIIAFRAIHFLVLFGFLTAGISSYLFMKGQLGGAVWMQCVGLGLYMAYIPFNAIYFERMIASFRLVGNVGFLIYIIDAFGYLGSVTVMLFKETQKFQVRWTDFFANAVVGLAAIGITGTLFALYYFSSKHKKLITHD
jgi:MFS family permease